MSSVRVAGGEEQHRGAAAVGAQPPAHLEAVEVGQHHVEHDQVGPDRRRRRRAPRARWRRGRPRSRCGAAPPRASSAGCPRRRRAAAAPRSWDEILASEPGSSLGGTRELARGCSQGVPRFLGGGSHRGRARSLHGRHRCPRPPPSRSQSRPAPRAPPTPAVDRRAAARRARRRRLRDLVPLLPRRRPARGRHRHRRRVGHLDHRRRERRRPGPAQRHLDRRCRRRRLRRLHEQLRRLPRAGGVGEHRREDGRGPDTRRERHARRSTAGPSPRPTSPSTRPRSRATRTVATTPSAARRSRRTGSPLPRSC